MTYVRYVIFSLLSIILLSGTISITLLICQFLPDSIVRLDPNGIIIPIAITIFSIILSTVLTSVAMLLLFLIVGFILSFTSKQNIEMQKPE